MMVRRIFFLVVEWFLLGSSGYVVWVRFSEGFVVFFVVGSGKEAWIFELRGI